MLRARLKLAIAIVAGLAPLLSGFAEACVIQPPLAGAVADMSREALLRLVEQKLGGNELVAEAIYLGAVKADGGDVDGLQVTHRLSIVRPFKGSLDRGQLYVTRMLVAYKGCPCRWTQPQGGRCDPAPIGYPFSAAENERMIVFMTPARTSQGLAYASVDEVVRSGLERQAVSGILSALTGNRR